MLISKRTGHLHLKCVAHFAIILTLGSLLCFMAYYNMLIDSSWYSKMFSSQGTHDYFVKSYQLHVSDGILEMKGYYTIGNLTHRASLKLNGLDVLLNDLKSKFLNDPKLEKALLPDQNFFVHDRNVKDINCRLIINGNESETKIASNMSALQPRKNPIGPMDYINRTSDCQTFIHERGYIMSTLTKIEAAFPLAFSILMYKDIEQVERLLRAIYRPQNIYCIHVDKKTDNEIYRAMKGITNCFDNVFMTTTRIDVQWGQFSVLEPELMCIKELLQRNKKWKYFINLTGQEFPLRTNYELVRILMTYNGANDIEGTVKRFVLCYIVHLIMSDIEGTVKRLVLCYIVHWIMSDIE